LIYYFLDETGQVLPNTDFPRVFFLMHKWFMESESLADILYEMYEKCELEQQQQQQQQQQQTVQPSQPPQVASPTPQQLSCNDQKLKICYTLR
jgi:hypothetical protein